MAFAREAAALRYPVAARVHVAARQPDAVRLQMIEGEDQRRVDAFGDVTLPLVAVIDEIAQLYVGAVNSGRPQFTAPT